MPYRPSGSEAAIFDDIFAKVTLNGLRSGLSKLIGTMGEFKQTTELFHRFFCKSTPVMVLKHFGLPKKSPIFHDQNWEVDKPSKALSVLDSHQIP
jgi:hypothetical protein